MDQSGDGPAPKGLITSAQRALRILETVALAGDGVPAKVIARRADVKLSTAYQLINTLVHDGYLVRLTSEHGYGLGNKLFELQGHAEADLRRGGSPPPLHVPLRVTGVFLRPFSAHREKASLLPEPSSSLMEGHGAGGTGCHGPASGNHVTLTDGAHHVR